MDALFSRAERLAQTRPERLRLHLSLVQLMVHQIERHLAGGRAKEAASAWTNTLECFVEDSDQKFTVDSWARLDELWPAPRRRQLAFREPLAMPRVRTD